MISLCKLHDRRVSCKLNVIVDVFGRGGTFLFQFLATFLFEFVMVLCWFYAEVCIFSSNYVSIGQRSTT